ncbi:MAG: hypothetical protein GXP26_03990 [Planctomycetes bacterium]|nr:hypothetical protein [Planctomycetota bacterium]
MKKLTAGMALIFSGTLLALPMAATATPPTLEWIDQFGSNDLDSGYGVSTDGLGNVYISGRANGSLKGAGDDSVGTFLGKYNASGTLLWIEQLGTSSPGLSTSVSADGLGNVYISGFTSSGFEGPNAGIFDAFVSKYDASGSFLWTKQLGTSGIDFSWGVSADGLGNVYISGRTDGSLDGPSAGNADAFLSKYDASGTLLWTEQLGTSSGEESTSVSADGLGNVYISGYTWGSLGGPNVGGADAFLSKYDASGSLLWTEQLGTSAYDYSDGVSVDGLGNVYISGWTWGNLEGPNAGGHDAFVSKYNANGTLLWTAQLGTSSGDKSYGVSADGLGNVYISGYTDGSLGGPSAGGADAFVSKYDADGSLLWTGQLGTGRDDKSWALSADGLGNVYISGFTLDRLEGSNPGGADAFLAKFSDPIPEPSSLLLGVMASLGLLVGRRRSR